MVEAESPRNRAKGRACQRCHDTKRRCEDYNSGGCVGCLEANVTCTPRAILSTNGKRKKEEIADVSDSEPVQTKRASSSVTVAHSRLDTLFIRKDSDQHKAHKPLRLPAQKKRQAEIWFCGICESEYKAKMMKCAVPICGLWCHVSCVYNFKDRRHMLFSSPTGLKESWIICPKCMTHQSEYVSEAIAEYANTMRRLKGGLNSAQEQWPEPFVQMDFSSQTIEDQQDNLPQEDEYLGLATSDFELAREGKFQGFDKAEMDGLVNSLHQSIYNYTKDIKDTIDRFGDSNEACIRNPLADWTAVDFSENFVSGQPWYCIERPLKNQPRSHLPITAALRGILNSPNDKPLEIDPKLANLTFSQVHTGFVGWFVADVINNELDIFQLPNMKPMRVMMSAVKDFADARWPGNGQYALREVNLRTWYKSPFEKIMLADEGNLMRRMETYLDPLTKNFEKISRWSFKAADVIEDTLKLWSYLQSLRGKLVPIRPVIGDDYDSRQHEAFNKDGQEDSPEKQAKKKILWILRPGFQLKEDSPEKPQSLTVKAHVFLE